MCVIFKVAPGEQLTADEIEAAGFQNDDGWGIAWLGEGGLVQWEKGIDTKEMSEALEGLKDVEYIAHARLATAGDASESLTHPFPVTANAGLALSGQARQVLFHNGHWFKWEEALAGLQALDRMLGKIPDGEWSDSRLLAYLAARYGDGAKPAFSDAGKVAIIGPEGVKLYGSFDKVRPGVVASNLHWDIYAGYAYSEYSHGWGGHFAGNSNTYTYTSHQEYSSQAREKALDKFSIGDTVQVDASVLPTHVHYERELDGMMGVVVSKNNYYVSVRMYSLEGDTKTLHPEALVRVSVTDEEVVDPEAKGFLTPSELKAYKTSVEDFWFTKVVNAPGQPKPVTLPLTVTNADPEMWDYVEVYDWDVTLDSWQPRWVKIIGIDWQKDGDHEYSVWDPQEQEVDTIGRDEITAIAPSNGGIVTRAALEETIEKQETHADGCSGLLDSGVPLALLPAAATLGKESSDEK